MKSTPNRSNQQGYIALAFVMVVGAISLTIAVTILLAGTDSQRTLLVTARSAAARAMAATCAEEALQQIHDNIYFTGSATLTLDDGSCTYTVTSTGSNTMTIDASALAGNVTRKVQALVSLQPASQPTSETVTAWRDVN